MIKYGVFQYKKTKLILDFESDSSKIPWSSNTINALPLVKKFRKSKTFGPIPYRGKSRESKIKKNLIRPKFSNQLISEVIGIFERDHHQNDLDLLNHFRKIKHLSFDLFYFDYIKEISTEIDYHSYSLIIDKPILALIGGFGLTFSYSNH